MSARHTGLFVVFVLAAVGVLADYFLKIASERTNSAQSKWFWLGLSVYALMAGGWVYVMRHLSFSQMALSIPYRRFCCSCSWAHWYSRKRFTCMRCLGL